MRRVGDGGRGDGVVWAGCVGKGRGGEHGARCVWWCVVMCGGVGKWLEVEDARRYGREGMMEEG